MGITEQQIKERAREIGDRPYHPVTDDANSMYRTERSNGITIRFELMRTAIGGMDFKEYRKDWGYGWEDEVANDISKVTNALLLEMARQELGVTE